MVHRTGFCIGGCTPPETTGRTAIPCLWSEEFSVVTIESLRYAKFLDEQRSLMVAAEAAS